MDDAGSRGLLRPFADLPAPRGPNIVHPLSNIFLIALMAVTCGATDWQSICQWGKTTRPWLATFLDLSAGIPSRDTFRRLFAALDPDAFERCFLAWTAELVRSSGGRLIAVDGKTLRRSFQSAGGKAAIHMVSAWCEQNHVVLGQLAVAEKSNEITAIPKLLELLDIQGATVSIDAMGCQKEIARQIVDQQGDYLLAVKDNHKTLHEDVRFFLDEAIAQDDPHLTKLKKPLVEADHGRLETRRLWASHEVDWLIKQGHLWPGLRGIVCVEGERHTFADGKTTIERRYYLTSHDPRKMGAAKLLEMVRGHWGVENKLHWCLDMSFQLPQQNLWAICGSGNRPSS